MAEWSDEYLGMLGHLVSDVSGKIILLRVHQSTMFLIESRVCFSVGLTSRPMRAMEIVDVIIQQLVSNVSYK